MRRWLSLSEYHWLVLLLLLGACATVVAWVSIDLVRLAMANVDFLTRFGTEALREGGLVQLLGIGVRAVIVLVVYLGFKGIEAELIHRWRGRGE
jgi:hypothetical protein